MLLLDSIYVLVMLTLQYSIYHQYYILFFHLQYLLLSKDNSELKVSYLTDLMNFHLEFIKMIIEVIKARNCYFNSIISFLDFTRIKREI